jgi:hypothetical protein
LGDGASLNAGQKTAKNPESEAASVKSKALRIKR